MNGDVGDEVIIMPVVYPCRPVSVSLLGSFHLLVHLLNLRILPFHCLSYNAIFKSIPIKRGGGEKIINPHKDKSRHAERRNQMRVTAQENFVMVADPHGIRS